MTLRESILITEQAIQNTNHEIIKILYEDILVLLYELRDGVELFDTESWHQCSHELYNEYTSIAGTLDEKIAESDIVEFLERYESDINYCINRSYPTDRSIRLAEGWDPKI